MLDSSYYYVTMGFVVQLCSDLVSLVVFSFESCYYLFLLFADERFRHFRFVIKFYIISKMSHVLLLEKAIVKLMHLFK